MKNTYITKQDKLLFILEKLDKLKGLEFIDDDEIKAVNYASTILRNKIKELDKKQSSTPKNKQYIENCPVCNDCNKCYRNIICSE